MTYEETTEWLERYRKQDAKIRVLELESKSLSSFTYDGSVRAHSIRSPIENIVAELEDARSELQRIREEIDTELEKLEQNERDALHLRYITLMGTDEISIVMAYTPRQIRRFISSGIRNMSANVR